MNSETASHKPGASGESPKQLGYLPYLKLNDGHEIPMLAYGLGTARVRGKDADGPSREIIELMKLALKLGFNHLDGAELYRNEEEFGIAIKESGMSREAIYVTTKASCQGERSLEESFSASLKRLDLEYIDLYLLHYPFWAKSPAELQAKWVELEAIKASGRVRSIGVSNFLIDHLETILATAKIPPAINQIELHPWLPRTELLAYLREKNIAVSAYGPLTAVTKAAKGDALEEAYAELAKKYGVSPSEIGLRWCIDSGIVAITTSSNEGRMRQYQTKIPSFKLTPKEVEKISQLGATNHYRGFFTNYFAEGDRR
ncbi:hypothetical protein RB594_005203 [Gaeumannomyces avenae]